MYNPNNPLPYDYARCGGKKDSPTCLDCMRRLSPDRSNGWGQSYLLTVPDEDGKCSVKISVERWRNR